MEPVDLLAFVQPVAMLLNNLEFLMLLLDVVGDQIGLA